MSFWTPERLDELKRLRLQGLSCAQIATEMGAASRNAVIGALSRNDIRVPLRIAAAKKASATKAASVQQEREKIVRAGWLAGKNTEEIALEIGIHRSAVYFIARRLGIEFQRRPEAKALAHRLAGEALKQAARPALFTAPIEHAGQGIGLMELTSRTCRYPLWADDAAVSQLYCGQGVDVIGSYCPHHRLVATSLSNKEGGGKNRLWKPPGTARTAWT